MKGGGRKRKAKTAATSVVVPKKVKRAAKKPSRTTPKRTYREIFAYPPSFTSPTMEPTVANSAFDIFEFRPMQSSILETIEEPYNPVAGVEFLVPATSDMYIDPNIKLFIRCRLTKTNGTVLDESDFTGVTNNLLHSLFSVPLPSTMRR